MPNAKLTDGMNEGVTTNDVLRAVYNSMTPVFKERIEPLFEQEGGLEKFGNALSQYEVHANEFMYELINQIGRINVNVRTWTSPLKEFKRGFLEYGDTIEDIYIEPIKAMGFEAEVSNDNPGDVFQTFKPKTDVVYYKQNKELVYPLTLNKNILKRAFRSYRELDKYIAGQMQAMYNGDEIDDYLLTVALLEEVYEKKGFYNVHIDEINSTDTAKAFARQVNTIVEGIHFPTRKYNGQGVLSWSRKEDLVLVLEPSTAKWIDVDVLAYAFNMDKAELMGKKVIVDHLPTGVSAMLIDREAFQIYDTLVEMATSPYNGRHLTINYFLHHHGIFAFAPYWTAIAFTTNAVTEPTAVAITGSDTIKKGSESFYTASVTGGATNAVEWKIKDNPQYASIDQNGKLTVGKLFKGASLTIVATSVEKETVTTTKDITVN